MQLGVSQVTYDNGHDISTGEEAIDWLIDDMKYGIVGIPEIQHVIIPLYTFFSFLIFRENRNRFRGNKNWNRNVSSQEVIFEILLAFLNLDRC